MKISAELVTDEDAPVIAMPLRTVTRSQAHWGSDETSQTGVAVKKGNAELLAANRGRLQPQIFW